MAVRTRRQLLETLESTLHQLLVIIENNPLPNAFAGTADLTETLALASAALDLPKAICFEHRESQAGQTYTRVHLTWPYGDCGVGYIVEKGMQPTDMMSAARQTAAGLLRVWLGLIPIWNRDCGGSANASDHTNPFLPTPIQEAILAALDQNCTF